MISHGTEFKVKYEHKYFQLEYFLRLRLISHRKPIFDTWQRFFMIFLYFQFVSEPTGECQCLPIENITIATCGTDTQTVPLWMEILN